MKYIQTHFHIIYPRHVELLNWLLIECRQHFDGDLDLMLVLSVIGERTLPAAGTHAPFDLKDLRDGLVKPAAEPINIQSVAEFSGIPRETVRRKVQELIKRGWIERAPSGNLRATRTAAGDLEALTQKTVVYLAKMRALLTKP
jgi:Fic family protein